MNSSTLMTLSLIAAMATPAFAQEADADTMVDEVVEEMADQVEDAATTLEETMADDAMSDDAMADDTMEDGAMVDDVMADDATGSATTLEEIAASDPNLSVTTDEDGEVDAMVMLSDVLFGFGDASLAPEALITLRGVADKLDGVQSIEITGHTDAIGDEAYNLTLGQQRADAVRDWLVANTDLTAEVVSARGVGEVDPLVPNTTEDGADDPEARAQNRRVEFTLPGES